MDDDADDVLTNYVSEFTWNMEKYTKALYFKTFDHFRDKFARNTSACPLCLSSPQVIPYYDGSEICQVHQWRMFLKSISYRRLPPHIVQLVLEFFRPHHCMYHEYAFNLYSPAPKNSDYSYELATTSVVKSDWYWEALKKTETYDRMEIAGQVESFQPFVLEKSEYEFKMHGVAMQCNQSVARGWCLISDDFLEESPIRRVYYDDAEQGEALEVLRWRGRWMIRIPINVDRPIQLCFPDLPAETKWSMDVSVLQ